MEKVLLTDNPEKFFATMRDAKALVKIFPELDKLWGTPQSPQWHPEIDTGLHTMLSLQQAVKLSTDPKVRFAVLCHDLGKGSTKPELLPRHLGHEHRGVSLVNNWCSKYKVPNSYKNLAVRAAKWHLHSHRALELNPKTILGLFDGLDAFRQPQNLADFLIACTADARGRQGSEHASYSQADFLQQIFAMVRQINADEFIAQGLTGKKIGEAIRKQQLYLVKKFKQQYTSQT
jgi:tRNA nucleotidyltransferase (CCA-adding enzyme)